MLNGIYTYNVDGKGRIVMPGRFLDALGNPFVLTGTQTGCLVAASRPDLLREPSGVRGFVECRIKDRTGRFVIPSALREYADLHQTGEAAVIGAGDQAPVGGAGPLAVPAARTPRPGPRPARLRGFAIPHRLRRRRPAEGTVRTAVSGSGGRADAAGNRPGAGPPGDGPAGPPAHPLS